MAVVLMLAGSCGAGNSIVRLTGGPTPGSVQTLPDDASLDTVEAQRAALEAMARTAREAPYVRVLDATNIALSAMLLVGGTMLLLLRRDGPWWVTQAATANALWTVAFAASHVYQLVANAPELRSKLRALAEAMRADPRVPAASLPVDGLVLAVGARVAVALLTVHLYGWLAWRVRRPDIREVLEEAERARM